MLTFPRSLARRLRLLARKSLAGRPRGPAPPVLLTPNPHGSTLSIDVEEVIVALRIDGDCSSFSPVHLPMEVFESVEGAGTEPVRIEWDPKRITATWTDRGLPRSRTFPPPVPNPAATLPPLPKTISPVPPQFVTALHEAARSTAREANRYALQRVQIRGREGEVIGTDSYFVVRYEGFALPFATDILVPAVPLFGLEDWKEAGTIRVGRTAKHFVMMVDDVTIWLEIDTAGRFPDVSSVFPRMPKPATLRLDPADALVLLDALPALPGQDEQHRPVTLDLTAGSTGIVRAKAETAREVVEVRLPRSTVQGGSIRIALDRRSLIRMLTLGCCSFQVFREDRPVVARGDALTTLVMPIDPGSIVPSSASPRVMTPDSYSAVLTPTRTPMKTPEPPTNGDGETLDPLVEADALRNALGEAQHRLGRLLTTLRSKKKEQKALNQVWSSLKQLNLGG